MRIGEYASEFGVAFGDVFLLHHPPAEARCTTGSNLVHSATLRTGFGGWADEEIEIAREAVPLTSRKKSHPQHLRISRLVFCAITINSAILRTILTL